MCTKKSTASGASIDATVAELFVMAINVPEWFGDRSMWLILKPLYWAELNPTATTSKIIVVVLSVTKHSDMSAMAGTPNPKLKENKKILNGY